MIYHGEIFKFSEAFISSIILAAIYSYKIDKSLCQPILGTSYLVLQSKIVVVLKN